MKARCRASGCRELRTGFAVILFLFLVHLPFQRTAQAQFTTSGHDIYLTDPYGAVGIGTPTPLSKVDVQTGTDQHLVVEPGTARGGADGIGLTSLNDADTAYKGITLAGTNIVMNATGGTGNVGIGVASPAYNLSLYGADSGSSNSSTTGSQLAVEGDFHGIYFRMKGASSTGIGGATYANQIFSRGGTIGLELFSDESVVLGSANTERMRIDNSGHVGIGTTTPSSALEVIGDVAVSGNISAKYQDLAEWVPTSQAITPGTVVIEDPNGVNSVVASTESYDTRVAGVVSANPGIVLGEAGAGKVRVATTGRVKVHVDATRAPIRAGDLLVTSDREGTAMRSEPVDVAGIRMHRPGTLIGKALEPLSGGEGEILVLLSLQ